MSQDYEDRNTGITRKPECSGRVHPGRRRFTRGAVWCRGIWSWGDEEFSRTVLNPEVLSPPNPCRLRSSGPRPFRDVHGSPVAPSPSSVPPPREWTTTPSSRPTGSTTLNVGARVSTTPIWTRTPSPTQSRRYPSRHDRGTGSPSSQKVPLPEVDSRYGTFTWKPQVYNLLPHDTSGADRIVPGTGEGS